MFLHDVEDAYHLVSLAGCQSSSQHLLDRLSNRLNIPDSTDSTPSSRPRLVVWVDDFAIFAYQTEFTIVD